MNQITLILAVLTFFPLFTQAQSHTVTPQRDGFLLRLDGRQYTGNTGDFDGDVKIYLQRSDDNDDALMALNANTFDGIIQKDWSLWEVGLRANDEMGIYYTDGAFNAPHTGVAMSFRTSSYLPYVSFGSPDYLARITVLNTSYGQKGIHTTSHGNAIYGESTSNAPAVPGIGVYGKANKGAGVKGESVENYGVNGKSDLLAGIYGHGINDAGVRGEGKYGVYGESIGTEIAGVRGKSTDGNGVYGSSTNKYGVLGYTMNTSSYAGYFLGDVYSTGTYTMSDQRLKSHSQALSDGRHLINQLRPVKYHYQDASHNLRLPEGERFGLIAQELEMVFPHLVKSSSHPTHDAEGEIIELTGNDAFKAVNYTELIPVLIAALQEQDEIIESLQARVRRLEK